MNDDTNARTNNLTLWSATAAKPDGESRRTWQIVPWLITLIVAFATYEAGVNADVILEINDASLTTYVPSAKSSVQDVRPLVDQRGVNVDGSLRASATHRAALNGAPVGGAGWNSNQVMNGMRLDTGTYLINDVDLAFPAQVPWIVGRTYNARQKDSGGSYFASGGYQGNNWFQSSQPELVFHDSATDSEDMIYLIYGADRYIEFRRGDDEGQGDSADTFRAVNGATGVILITTAGGSPDLATYYDQSGSQLVFFWFGDGDIDDDIEGSFWKKVDPAGNAAYVGHETNAATALSSYDATTGAVTTAYDSAGRRFTYTYTSGQLTEVKAEDNPGSWTEVGKVEYSYYVGADSHGELDDLELVTITLPLTDSGISSVRKKYYWYYEGTYHATSNPGYHHQLQYIIDFEGYRGYDWDQDSSLDDDPQSASESAIKPYASAYFAYDTERRIVSAWFNGSCGCSGASSGTHNFKYEDNGSYSDGSGYDTTWKGRTIVEKPAVTYKTADDAVESWVVQYFDEVGQPLHRVFTDDDPDTASNEWPTKVTRDSAGRITNIHTPANVTAYTHSTAAFSTSTSVGLVQVFGYVSSGNLEGMLNLRSHQTGTSGSAYRDLKLAYTSRTLSVGDAGLTKPVLASRRVYSIEVTSGNSGSYLTSYSTTWQSSTNTNVLYLAPKVMTTTNPAVSTSTNGSGSATTSKRYLRQDGSTAFTESPSTSFTYTQFTDGALTKRIDDAQTNHGTDFPTGDDPNTDFGITETADGVRRITTYAYDDQGRSDTVTQSDGRVLKRYYSRLSDQRQVTLSYNAFDASPLKFYGPVQYSVTNHAGRAEAQATVSLGGNESTSALTTHVDETDSDPITAMDLGTVARLQTSVYDDTGSAVEETRTYFDIPASGSGSDGTNYDATFVGYDDQGRQMRSKAPHGTISRTSYDTLGRVASQWIGTNDSDFDGGESSGTDDMVKTAESEYDSGSASGNSLLTEQTLFVEDSTTDERVTTFDHDVRGRVLLQTNAEAPHTFNKYDNMGRVIASGQFSSTASIVVGTDDPTTETASRLALSQSFYDEMGRVWKSQRHKIDDADGSDDDNLQTLTWYDADGRVVKVDGSQLTKTTYDRLGRQTHQFTLASDNDTAYANVDDVTGDIVLLESQTVYESTDSDDVLMAASISRFHDDYSTGETTGALDTNADGDDLALTASNLEGRVQINAMWYDAFGRVTDQASYGTNGGATFDRDGLSVPTRSDTILVTSTEYSPDGSVKAMKDPKNLVTRPTYDDAGRQTEVIANYVNGTPSGPNGDDDNLIRYVYTDGLQTKMWVDLDGDNVEDTDDQVTTYTFGTTKGASAGDSKIATGHLLQEVAYPDSASASDVVTFAYNAQSQEIYKKDQDGNVFETDYDDAGRQTHLRITTLASGFDGAVLRISSAYDDLGRVDTVTQYDNATVGSGSIIDEVGYTYDDWGPVAKFEQDHDSAVGGSLLYDVDFTYAKATNGRNTIRRSSMDLPDGTTVTAEYVSTGNLHDEEASRVTQLKISTTVIAAYDYNGVGQVVGIEYPEIDVMSQQYSTTSGSYPDLDRFGRVTTSKWTKDLTTDVDFYNVDITYDRNSNITLIDDNVHAGFDVEYTIDGLNRLTNAEEGTWNGSSITSRSREQKWTELSQTGNWERVKLDLDGDGVFTGTDEYDDDRAHNVVNEITQFSPPLGTANPVHDKSGNLTDDDSQYLYEYDAFGRMTSVTNQIGKLVSKYTYNGLGYRIGWHYDVDADGIVESTSDDPWYRFVYDDRWRIVGTYRASDSDPKEQFVYHAAGADGLGTSSYIDDVVLRDKDANTAWESASDGTLEERVYHCQNWRHDVVALIDDAGVQLEQARYLSYGIPFGLPAADCDSDGDVDGADVTAFDGWIAYDVRGDLDLDGNNDSNDRAEVVRLSGNALGFGALSLDDVGSRKGYAGYEIAAELVDSTRLYHVRHRVLGADLGQWTRRDPLGYVDGASVYAYATSNPGATVDSSGFAIEAIVGDPGPPVDPDECYLPPQGPAPWVFPPWPAPPGLGGGPPDRGSLRGCCYASFAREPGPLAHGRVVCCGGRKIICLGPGFPSQRSTDTRQGRDGQGHARLLMLNCLLAHESRHVGDHNLSCDGVENGGRPRYLNDTHSGDNFNCRHCKIFALHLACLDAALSQCDSLSPAEAAICRSELTKQRERFLGAWRPLCDFYEIPLE